MALPDSIDDGSVTALAPLGSRHPPHDHVLEALAHDPGLEPRGREQRTQFIGRPERRVESDKPFSGDKRPAADGPWTELLNDHDATGPKHRPRRRERCLGIRKVMKRVDHHRGIGGIVTKRQRSRIAADGVVPRLSRPPEHPSRDIDDDWVEPGVGETIRGASGSAGQVRDPLDPPVGEGEALTERSDPSRRHHEVVEIGDPIEESNVTGTEARTHIGDTGEGTKSLAAPTAGILSPDDVSRTMEYALLGWPPDGPTLRLDHRRFAYAGKFVMSTTGKAVVRRDGADAKTDDDLAVAPDGVAYDTDVVAALAFDTDHTDGQTLRYRYISARSDLRGEGLGPRLAAVVAPRAADRGYDRVAIAVNNPFAYEAMYKAGFAWTGRESGLAELVLERPARLPDDEPPPDTETYQSGLDRYRERELSEPETSFLAARAEADPPERIVDGDFDPLDPDG